MTDGRKNRQGFIHQTQTKPELGHFQSGFLLKGIGARLSRKFFEESKRGFRIFLTRREDGQVVAGQFST